MSDIKEVLQSLKKFLKDFIDEGCISGASLGPELCKGMACFGTPGEIAKLIRAGYGHALCGVSVEGTVISEGGRVATKRFVMVQLSHDHNGCVMHKSGKCLLMDSGLTPTMGVIHLLTNEAVDDLLKEAMIPGLVMGWVDSENKDAIRFCLESLERIKKISHNHTN